MTADEIRNWPITDAGLAMHEPHRVAIDSAEFLRELAAQVAESNESRKPRWVNIPSEAGPRLIDANQVVALSCGYISNGMAAPTAAVYVRLSGIAEPLIVTEYDHDEVRFKLGIDENWIQSPAPIAPFDWRGANAMAFAGRVLIKILREKDSENTTQALEVLEAAIDSWEDVPF